MTLLLSATAGLAGCATSDDGGDTAEAEGDAGKADDGAELYVRAGDTSLWMNQALVRRARATGGEELVMRGRTSRNLVDGRGFIYDDIFGEWMQKSARTFELVFPTSSSRGLIDGVQEFIQLDFVHSSSRPDVLFARTIVRPRLVAFTGSSHLYFTAELTPVVMGGRTVYRIKGHTTGAGDVASALQVQIGDQSLTDVRVIGGTQLEADLDPETAMQIIGGTTDLVFTVSLPSGPVTKRAKLGAWIKKLGFTSGDVETVWPPVTCTAETRACLEALPDGQVDLAACGEAVAVNACAGQVGAFVDAAAVSAALHTAQVELATPAWRQDGIGLVGADRVDAFLGNSEQIVESRLEGLFGRWYLSTAARDAAVAAAVAGGLDTALARPLDYFEPRPAAPGDLVATRQVVADAVLAHVGSLDLRTTEWGRTMEELVHDFRAQHVQSIRNFRETIEPAPYPGHPEWDYYAGDWLGAYVEVSVLRTTGEVVNVLLEID